MRRRKSSEEGRRRKKFRRGEIRNSEETNYSLAEQ
jgi:hypothetical protein